MASLTGFMGAFGQIVILSGRTLREAVRPPFEFRLTLAQLELGGVDSWSITLLTAIFTGMVMATQFAIGLEPFGASIYTSLLVGGRVGAGFTAELGSMAVTEQIDAIRALGADPIRKLVVPRVVAMTIAIPLLTIMADLIGCAGGIIITVAEVGVTFTFAVEQMIDTVRAGDFLHGLIKSLFFGGIIAILACWRGMTTYGGTEGVGRATTETVVYTSVSILFADFLLTRVLTAVYM